MATTPFNHFLLEYLDLETYNFCSYNFDLYEFELEEIYPSMFKNKYFNYLDFLESFCNNIVEDLTSNLNETFPKEKEFAIQDIERIRKLGQYIAYVDEDGELVCEDNDEWDSNMFNNDGSIDWSYFVCQDYFTESRNTFSKLNSLHYFLSLMNSQSCYEEDVYIGIKDSSSFLDYISNIIGVNSNIIENIKYEYDSHLDIVYLTKSDIENYLNNYIITNKNTFIKFFN